MLDSTLPDVLRCSLLHQEMPGWKEAIASFTRSGGYANLSDRIAEVRHPTLILWGKADDVLGAADAMRFQQAISKSRLVWIGEAVMRLTSINPKLLQIICYPLGDRLDVED